MNPELEHLVVLQAQDIELGRLRSELAAGPERVQAAAAAVQVAQQTLAGLANKLSAEEKLRRGQESEIGTYRTKLDRLQRSLNAATSAQQVTAFEHEIAFARSEIGRLEDEELASMERTEALEAERHAAVAALERATQAHDAARTSAAEVKVRHEETIAGIERERAELRAGIEPHWLATYDKLQKTRGTAVAEAIGSATAGKCAACQMGVRPQRWQDLTGRDHLDEIFSCESCGRLLFWDPRRDTPKPWAAGERLGAALAASGSSRPGGGAR